ncbi:MAG: YbhB/YbcL family Raf kinase inhibitor-like protein [Methanobacterium sp.]
MVIKIKSKVFEDGEPIPTKYTCSGVDVSPPLEWTSIPEDTESIGIICEDPDAPGGTWSHWIIFNLPADTMSLSEHIMSREIMDNGAIQGLNDFGKVGYAGPCPPKGTHHYYYKIYALDVKLDLPPRTSRKTFLETINGHIIDQGQIMGTYTR